MAIIYDFFPANSSLWKEFSSFSLPFLCTAKRNNLVKKIICISSSKTTKGKDTRWPDDQSLRMCASVVREMAAAACISRAFLSTNWSPEFRVLQCFTNLQFTRNGDLGYRSQSWKLLTCEIDHILDLGHTKCKECKGFFCRSPRISLKPKTCIRMVKKIK